MKNLKIIRPKKLADVLSVSAATLWRMEKRGELPPKVVLSKRAVGWREADIENWIEENIIDKNNSNPEGGIDDE